MTLYHKLKFCGYRLIFEAQLKQSQYKIHQNKEFDALHSIKSKKIAPASVQRSQLSCNENALSSMQFISLNEGKNIHLRMKNFMRCIA